MLVTFENEIQVLCKLDNIKILIKKMVQKSEEIASLDDLQNVKRIIEDLKIILLHMINDRLFTSEVYKHMREKVEKLIHELKTTNLIRKHPNGSLGSRKIVCMG